MTFNDLQQTLQAAVATEKIGTPVALRVHGIFARDLCDPASALASVVCLSGTLFSSPPQRLTARGDADAQQWNVLLNYAGGETLLFSVVCGDSPPDGSSLHLILIGNHGIVRLEGAEMFGNWPMVETQDAEYWRRHLNESRSQQCGVDLPACGN